MKCTAAANSVSDMVHDAAAAHPSAAVVGMVAWDCEGEKDLRLMRIVRSA